MKRFFSIIGLEFRTIFRDEGVLLVLVGALLLYSALYGLIYEPEVVRDMPVAVVDMDSSPASQELTRALDATSAAHVAYTCGSLEQARVLFLEGKVCGVMLIDKDYQKNQLAGLVSSVSVYADGSYFLLYSGLLGAVSDVVLARGAQLSEQRIGELSPLNYKIEMLYNPYGGYASALLPAVLIVILQQVLLIGIGMLMGSCNEFNHWKRYDGSSALTITMGKALSYVIIYIPLCFYLFWIDYKLFHYPVSNTSEWEVVAFLLPYLLSVIFLGITLGAIFRRRESAILYLAVFSVFLIMISGISWPGEGMPEWLFYGGRIMPSSSAIDGFVRLRTAGASLVDVSSQWLILWALTFVFATTAVLAVSRARLLRGGATNQK
ncbi:MAG: ABC transporter permease [Mucinivorans sp.]